MTTFANSKDPAEKIVLTFDFSAELDTGETLTGSPTVVVSASNTVDISPAATLNGAAALDASSKMVLQAVQGGIKDVDYTYKVTCQTSNAQKLLVRVGILKVRLAETV